MKLKDVFTSALGCCTSTLALLNLNFAAYLTHWCVSPISITLRISVPLSMAHRSEQGTKVWAWARRHAMIRDCTYR